MNHEGTKDTKKVKLRLEGTDPDTESLANQVVDATFKVHRALGPGLLESAYEACLAYELKKRGLPVECQVPIPLVYEDVKLDVGFRIDLWIGKKLLVEIKAAEKMLPIHEAQLLTYLKITGNRLGLLINFNETLIKNGIRRVVL